MLELSEESDDEPDKAIMTMRLPVVEDEYFRLVRECADPKSVRAKQMSTERLQRLEVLYQAPMEVPVR